MFKLVVNIFWTAQRDVAVSTAPSHRQRSTPGCEEKL